MPEEERMKVLQMLEEGKIDVEEATRLLEAMGEGAGREQKEGKTERQAREERVERPKEERDRGFDLGSIGETAGEKAGDIGAEIGDKVGSMGDEIGEKVKEDVLESVFSALSGLGLGGSGFRFEEEITGDFAAERIDVFAKTRNGRIIVKGWEEPNWKVVLKKRVRAASKEEAEELAQELGSVEAGEDFLRVAKGNLSQKHSLRIELFLPSEKNYDLDLNSRNGRTIVEGLDCSEVGVETRNGRIILDGVEAKQMSLASRNGRVVVEGATEILKAETRNGRIKFYGPVRNADAQTSNGRIIFEPQLQEGDNEYRLETKNGRIKLNLPQEDCGYDVECETRLGKIRVSLPELEVEKKVKERRRRFYKARTPDHDKLPRRAVVECKTKNGAIKIR